MTQAIGPKALPQFEDRVLYHLVDITGDRPMGRWEGISEEDLAVPLAEELGISPDLPRSEGFRSSEAQNQIIAAVEALEDEGLVSCDKVLGPWTIRPTRDGRRRVQEWRGKWQEMTEARDRQVQRRILEELDRQRRDNPGNYRLVSRVDVDRLCVELEIAKDVYLGNAQRLLDQRKIALVVPEQLTLANGFAYITESGIQALKSMAAAQRPFRDAQEAWVEVARLRRRLQIAERTLPGLVADKELRSRCEDLLAAEGHYDRVVREACVVLEDRVRNTVGAARSVTAIPLMEQAFSPKNGPLKLSDLEQEQLGAMQVFRGMMAYFRNSAGHNLIETYTQEDALRFVAWVDLLLEMVARASSQESKDAQ